MTPSTFTTIEDVTEYVADALGDYADEHDTEAIAREVSKYCPRHQGFHVADTETFWDVVPRHAR